MLAGRQYLCVSRNLEMLQGSLSVNKEVLCCNLSNLDLGCVGGHLLGVKEEMLCLCPNSRSCSVVDRNSLCVKEVLLWLKTYDGVRRGMNT